MGTTEVGALGAALVQLKAAWPNGEWSWDDRMSMVSATVAGEQIEAGRAAAARAMPRCFDGATLESAPAMLVALVARYGGLRGGQCAFSDDTVFGLWWPWGGGGTVSLRIGVLDADEARLHSLRALFGV